MKNRNDRNGQGYIQVIVVVTVLLVLAAFATTDGIKIIDKSNDVVIVNDSRMLELDLVSMDEKEFKDFFNNLDSARVDDWKIIPNDIAKNFIDTNLDGDFIVNEFKRVKYIGKDDILESI